MATRTEIAAEKRRAIMLFIQQYFDQYGFMPTMCEIGDKVGIASTSHIGFHLEKLQAQGYIQREKSKQRHIRILRRMGQVVAN